MSEQQLRAVLSEIEARATSSHRAIATVTSQHGYTQRTERKLDLTISELTALPEDVKMYEGVGKMFVRGERTGVLDRLQTERRHAKEEKVALEKKLEYLTKTYENAKLHIDAAMNGGKIPS